MLPRILPLLLLLLIGPAEAAQYTKEAVKAAYLYRFASYVEWPEDAPKGPVVIAVAGADDVEEQLERLLPGMLINGRAVVARKVSRADDLKGAHIFYIGPKAFSRSHALRRYAADKPILTVTDVASGLDGGGIINFIDVNRNVRFEVSLVAAERSRLRINSALLSVAARVERRPQARTDCARQRCRVLVAGLNPKVMP